MSSSGSGSAGRLAGLALIVTAIALALNLIGFFVPLPQPAVAFLVAVLLVGLVVVTVCTWISARRSGTSWWRALRGTVSAALEWIMLFS